jgi:urease accessory protein
VDHLLVMLAVGLWSGFAMPRRLWAGATSFLLAMALGAGVAWSGVVLAGAEPAITVSVLVLGAMVFLASQTQSRASTLASLAGIACFGSLHGYAHAVESIGSGYLLGFLTTTAVLHLAGIGLARATARWAAADVAQKVLGGAVAASGLYLMVG